MPTGDVRDWSGHNSNCLSSSRNYFARASLSDGSIEPSRNRGEHAEGTRSPLACPNLVPCLRKHTSSRDTFQRRCSLPRWLLPRRRRNPLLKSLSPQAGTTMRDPVHASSPHTRCVHEVGLNPADFPIRSARTESSPVHSISDFRNRSILLFQSPVQPSCDALSQI